MSKPGPLNKPSISALSSPLAAYCFLSLLLPLELKGNAQEKDNSRSREQNIHHYSTIKCSHICSRQNYGTAETPFLPEISILDILIFQVWNHILKPISCYLCIVRNPDNGHQTRQINNRGGFRIVLLPDAPRTNPLHLVPLLAPLDRSEDISRDLHARDEIRATKRLRVKVLSFQSTTFGEAGV